MKSLPVIAAYVITLESLAAGEFVRSSQAAAKARSKCHQRIIREETAAEDVAELTPVLGDLTALKASHFDLAVETYGKPHSDFIRRYEWLGTPGVGIKWCFTARYKGCLGGVVLLSEPYYPSPDTALIARGACAGWTPKNVGSRLTMFGCRWMAKNTPKRKFIGYADSEANEIGQIYQACNFKFLGFKDRKYGLNETGERRSFQSLKRTSRMVPWLLKRGITLPGNCFTANGYLKWSEIPWDIKKLMREEIEREKQALQEVHVKRGKYVLVLGATDGETRRLNREFKEPVHPYPKRPYVSSSTSLPSAL